MRGQGRPPSPLPGLHQGETEMALSWLPEGAEAALSLTFDDGLPSQLKVAAPMLEQYGFCGTFYLNPGGEDWAERLLPWAMASRRGHELGNHTLSHPCSRNFSFTAENEGVEGLALEDMEREVSEAEARLAQLAPQQMSRSFAYPCYQSDIGVGLNRQSYTPVVAKYCTAARARGEAGNFAHKADLHYLWSFPCERMTAAEMIGNCELLANRGQWGILTFHGIDEGHLPVSQIDLEQLLQHLAKHRERFWVAPVVEVARAILGWRTG